MPKILIAVAWPLNSFFSYFPLISNFLVSIYMITKMIFFKDKSRGHYQFGDFKEKKWLYFYVLTHLKFQNWQTLLIWVILILSKKKFFIQCYYSYSLIPFFFYSPPNSELLKAYTNFHYYIIHINNGAGLLQLSPLRKKKNWPTGQLILCWAPDKILLKWPKETQFCSYYLPKYWLTYQFLKLI